MQHLYIIEIDGARTSGSVIPGLLAGPNSMTVAPGYHQFLVQCASGATTWTGKLWLNVEKGRSYYLHGIFKGLRFKAWFSEEGKEEPIGGELAP